MSEWDNEPLPTDPAELQAWRDRKARAARHEMLNVREHIKELTLNSRSLHKLWNDPRIRNYAAHRRRSLVYGCLMGYEEPELEGVSLRTVALVPENIRRSYCALWERMNDAAIRKGEYGLSDYPPELDENY